MKHEKIYNDYHTKELDTEGRCLYCGGELAEIWFEELEYDRNYNPTGRSRAVISHLTCKSCLKDVMVDSDYKASEWR